MPIKEYTFNVVVTVTKTETTQITVEAGSLESAQREAANAAIRRVRGSGRADAGFVDCSAEVRDPVAVSELQEP